MFYANIIDVTVVVFVVDQPLTLARVCVYASYSSCAFFRVSSSCMLIVAICVQKELDSLLSRKAYSRMTRPVIEF